MNQGSVSRELITGLDVGTSSVTVVISERRSDGKLEIIGRASHPSGGLKQGVVVNIEGTVHAIREAVNQVELMAGCKIRDVVVGISGTHVASRDTTGMVAVSNKEVSRTDIERVLSSASTVALNADQAVLHILPQEYIVDSQSGIADPIGMSGVRLEAKVHMVTCASSAMQNLGKCIEQCNLEIRAIVLEPLAASRAVMTEDERELGTCVVDIGAGTTDLLVVTDNAIRHIATIPVAGQRVTREIAMLLRTPNHDAERIKLHHACAWSNLVSNENIIEVPSVGGRPPREMSLSSLAPVVEACYEDVLKQVRELVLHSGYLDMLRAGIILTGGGSKVDGLVELTEEVMEMPARVGEPHGIDSVIPEIFDAQYATVVGLLLYENQKREREGFASNTKRSDRSGVVQTLRQWLNRNF